MKNLSNNKKGFTLIELLAVIVILAILVMLAIPAVTRYLNSARRNAFSDNALRAVEAVRNDVIEKGFSATRTTTGTGSGKIVCSAATCYYGLDAINELLETKLVTSSFGGDYKTVSGGNAGVCIVVNQNDNTYTMTMVDSGGNGFQDKVAGASDSKAINSDAVKNDGTQKASAATTAPAACGGANTIASN